MHSNWCSLCCVAAIAHYTACLQSTCILQHAISIFSLWTYNFQSTCMLQHAISQPSPINMHAAACIHSASASTQQPELCCNTYVDALILYCWCSSMHAPSQSNHLCNLSMLGLRLRTCHGSGPRGRASLRVGEGVAITTPWQSGLRSSRGCSTFGLGCLSYRRAHWVLC
jgi:hypothetical protein